MSKFNPGDRVRLIGTGHKGTVQKAEGWDNSLYSLIHIDGTTAPKWYLKGGVEHE